MTAPILSFGEPLVEFNQMPDDASGRRYLQDFGGDTSNFAIAVARAGLPSACLGALGEDRFGAMLRALWDAEGVSHAHVRSDPDAPTGLYFVHHDAQGHHFDYLRAGSAASRYAVRDLPLAAIAGAALLHVSGISLAISASACDAVLAAMAHARAHGVRVSLDTNLRLRLWPLARARALMREAFALTDICLPSWDDVTALTGLHDRDAIVDHLLAAGVKVVALKQGAEGSYVATPTERRVVPPLPVQAVDASGAGDCFGGNFCARLVAGDDPFTAAAYANAAAALSTTGYGAVAPIPRAAQVYAAMGRA